MIKSQLMGLVLKILHKFLYTVINYNSRAQSITTNLNAFEIDFCCFSSDSPEFLLVALNSFRKCCCNVLDAALHFLCIENL